MEKKKHQKPQKSKKHNSYEEFSLGFVSMCMGAQKQLSFVVSGFITY